MRNALNEQLLAELFIALDRIEATNDVYATVLTGNGPAFSAGGDIPTVQDWQSTDRSGFEMELAAFQEIISKLQSMSTPSIAALNGPQSVQAVALLSPVTSASYRLTQT